LLRIFVFIRSFDCCQQQQTTTKPCYFLLLLLRFLSWIVVVVVVVVSLFFVAVAHSTARTYVGNWSEGGGPFFCSHCNLLGLLVVVTRGLFGNQCVVSLGWIVFVVVVASFFC
jgi:hypothetical protein